jgi:hypothetical protein
MELIIFLLIFITPCIFVWVNFIAYLIKGKIITSKILWITIQLCTVVVLPALFLSNMDLRYKNDCCNDSAIFSPEHRIGIYTLIIMCAIVFVISIFRKNILPPVAEVFLNSFLILGLLLNIIFCIHFTTTEYGCIWWAIGNIPIIFLFFIQLAENQKLLNRYIEENDFTTNNFIGKCCRSILKLKPVFKYPVLTILLIPVIVLLSLFLILFGQKPDSIIKAFTDTYKHGFSQLDYMCDNVECGGHFLCSVGANGHKNIVKPIRYGERNANKIICNRQLLISNAFEELLQENFPAVHKIIRQHYNKVGNTIHKYYRIFNNKLVSDIVYIAMKPLEMLFLLALYTFDSKPENRIAMQYLSKNDKEKITTFSKFFCY